MSLSCRKLIKLGIGPCQKNKIIRIKLTLLSSDKAVTPLISALNGDQEINGRRL